MDKKKLQQIAFIAAVSLGTTLLLNTLAKRSGAVAGVKKAVDAGL